MFKSIGKAISNAYSSVKGAVKSAVNSLFTSGTGYNPLTANAFTSIPTASASTKNPVTGISKTGGTTYYNNYVPPAYDNKGNIIPNSVSSNYSGINSSGGFGSAPYGPPLPVNINAGQQRVSGGGSSNSDLSGFNLNSFAPATTISARTLGAQTGTGGQLQSGGGAITNPVVLSSNPTSTNPGRIDNTRLAGAVAGVKQYNSQTGQFEDIVDVKAKEETLDDKVKRQMDLRNELYKKYGVEELGSIYDDSEIRMAQERKRQVEENLRGPTAELNAIIAKQNQDLLQLRQTGSQEGVTEAVYGGQQSAINYNAAIRALPLQASIASLQGDLALAQDYLTELKTQKTEQIKRQSEYNKRIIDSIEGIMDDEDRKAGEAIKTKNELETRKAIMLEDYKYKVMENVLQNAPVSLRANLASRISNAQDMEGVARAAGQYNVSSGDNQIVKLDNGSTVIVDKNTGRVVKDLGGVSETGTGGTGYSSKQLSTLTKLNQDVSKNATYSKTTSMRNYGDNVIASLSQRTGVGDIAAINQFQKVIDEGAVTRDQDVKLIQQSQSLLNTLKTKVKKLEKGEQLSPDLRAQMQTAVEKMYEKQVEALLKDPYITAKKKEAELNGLTLSDTILGELQSFQQPTNTTNTIDYTKTLDNIFNSK